MNKKVYFIALILLIVSCSKKDNNTITIPKKDYTAFLSQSNQMFKGILDGMPFSWEFGIGTFQGTTGYENANGLCDSTNPWKVDLFGLSSTPDTGKSSFWLTTSPFDISSVDSLEMANIFSIGVKKLGEYGKSFSLKILQQGIYYQSLDELPNSEIEILKTQEYTNEYGIKNLRVWFRIDAYLQPMDAPGKVVKLTNGFMIANFLGFYK